jgi:competence protein ComEA
MKKWIVALLLTTLCAFSMSIGKLNTASKEELMQIKGIGEKKAEAIIKARKKGKFKSFDDVIARVPGIGEQTVANIKSGVKNGEASAKVKKSAKKTSKKAGKAEKKVKKTTRTSESKAKSVKDKKKKAKKAEKTLKKKKEKLKKSKKTKTTKKSKKAA